MAEGISFNEKIEGLIRFHQALGEMDPHNSNHVEVANPELFGFGGAAAISRPVSEAQRRILFEMATHGRNEYHSHRLYRQDLRQDTAAETAIRAVLLAHMTSPLERHVRSERAGSIATLLGRITAGDHIRISAYTHGNVRRPEQDVTIDNSRELFAVFTNGHASIRDLDILYDSPVTFGEDAGEKALTVNLPLMFERAGIVQEPLATA